jgi:hypothetical protein
MLQKIGSFAKDWGITKPLNALDGMVRKSYQSGEGGLGSAISSIKGAGSDMKTAGRRLKDTGTSMINRKSADPSAKLNYKQGAANALRSVNSSGYKGTAAGMAAGGAYGAMSDDTSVLGGMAMGGAAGFAAVKGSKAIHNKYGAK